MTARELPVAAPCPIWLEVHSSTAARPINIRAVLPPMPRRSVANHRASRVPVMIIRTTHIRPKCVSSVSGEKAPSRTVCTASIAMLEASTAISDAPITPASRERWAADAASAPSPTRLLYRSFHTSRAAIAEPSSMVCPASPGNRAAASGRYTSSSMESSGPCSSTMSPTAKTKVSGTRCPSTLESTLLATVYTPSSSGGVLTASDASSMWYAVSRLSIWLPAPS